MTRHDLWKLAAPSVEEARSCDLCEGTGHVTLQQARDAVMLEYDIEDVSIADLVKEGYIKIDKETLAVLCPKCDGMGYEK